MYSTIINFKGAFLCIIFILCANMVIAQAKASNIYYHKIDDKIEIFYDLPYHKDTINITVFFRKKSHPKMRYRIKNATGSIGIGTYSGKKQRITWNYKREPSYLFTGSGFYYEIVITKIKPRVAAG